MVVSSVSLPNFSFRAEAERGTMVSYARRLIVLPDTRVAMPQLCEELRTLPVEVSFTHGLTHVLTCSLQIKNIALKRH